MSDALATYLHDHLAGAAMAIDLAGRAQAQHARVEAPRVDAARRALVERPAAA